MTWPVLAALAIVVALAVLARGTAGDEEVGHFLIARWAPVHPELFLSLVGRPLVTLALALPSQFGLIGARIVAGLATVATAWCVIRLATGAGWRPAWLAAAFLLVQPFVLAHAATAMTEPFTALIVALGLMGVIERRPRLLLVAAAVAPLARLELVLFWPLVGAVAGWWGVPFRRIAMAGLLLLVPIALWNTLGALRSGDWLWLIHQSEWGAYPERDALHYLR